MKYVQVILTVVLVMPAPAELLAGAWTLKRGHYYSKIGILRFESSSQFLLNGERRPLTNNGRVTDWSFYSYTEYGVFDDLTFIASIPIKRIHFSCAIEDCGKTTFGLADIYTGMRYKLSESRWISAIQIGLKFAPGYETDEVALDTAPPLGDGQTDLEFRLLLGRSILNNEGYVNFDAGFRTRSGEPVDEVPFSVEAGLNLSPHYMLIGKLNGVRSIREDNDQENFRIVDGSVENFVGTGALEDFLKLQIQFIYKVQPFLDISFEFDRVLSGRNTSQASTFGIGMALHK